MCLQDRLEQTKAQLSSVTSRLADVLAQLDARALDGDGDTVATGRNGCHGDAESKQADLVARMQTYQRRIVELEAQVASSSRHTTFTSDTSEGGPSPSSPCQK
jgi:uncharacterized coiled-coil protein SlyX